MACGPILGPIGGIWLAILGSLIVALIALHFLQLEEVPFDPSDFNSDAGG
jgi:hypothetical protein